MNPRSVVVGLFALAAFGVGAACERRAPPTPTGKASPPSKLSQGEKDRIRDFWTIYRGAQTLKLAGRWKEAIPEYRRGLELDPDHLDSLYNLANCHFELDQFSEALETLKRLVQANEMSHRGYLQMGVIQAYPAAGDVFDLDAAQAAMERAFEINQEESGSMLRLGEVALAKGNVARAFEILTLANQSNFRAVEGYYLRGYIRWKEGRLDEARDLIVLAVRQSKKPTVVAEVPGEGDTKHGDGLPPTTVTGKVLIRKFWSGLPERYPEEEVPTEALQEEFAPLAAYLKDLRARMSKERGSK